MNRILSRNKRTHLKLSKKYVSVFVLLLIIFITLSPISVLAYDKNDIGEYIDPSKLEASASKYTFRVYTSYNYLNNGSLMLNSEHVLTGKVAGYQRFEWDISSGENIITIPTPPRVRTGYEFVGWNTKPDGSGHRFSVGDKINLLESSTDLWILASYDDYWYRFLTNRGDEVFSLSLYAQWRSIETGEIETGAGAVQEKDMHLTDENYTAVIGIIPGYQTTLWEWAMDIYGLPQTDDMADALMFQRANTTHKSVYSLIKSVHNIVLPIAYALITLYFFMKLAELTTQDQFNAEHFFKCMIWLIISLVVVNNSLDIINYGIQFANELYSAMISATNSESHINASELERWATILSVKRNFISLVGYTLELGVMKLAYGAACLVMWFFVWRRIFDMGIRAAFMPIGLANLFDEKHKAQGFSYLKKFLASCIQGVVLLGCFLILTIQRAASASIALTLELTLAAIVIMFKSESLARDVVDA